MDQVTNFYSTGCKSILIKRVEGSGEDETSYMHVLRIFLPKIARITFDEHDRIRELQNAGF